MAENQDVPHAPLTGIRVLDLGRHLAGPTCAMLLGDMGADVIKVENPEGGDHGRESGPPFFNGESAFFLSANRNKRSLTLDIKRPEGQEIFRTLADTADVVVENYRPGVMEALNIGYDTMSARNPGIIYCSISGFGVDGPFADRPGLDQIVQGFSGLMSVTGFEGSDPVRVGIPIADLLTGLYGAYGVLAALYARQETGRGQVVNTSLLECMVGTLAFQATRYLNSAGVPPPAGNHHPINAPYGVFRTKDGYITIGATGDKRWPKLCELLGMPDLPNDPRFNTNGGRYANRLELAETLETKLREKNSDEWEVLLNKNSIPCGPIYNVGQALDHPQVLQRQMVVERPHPTMGNVRLLGLPVKLRDTPGDVFRVPPLLGEQNDEILNELGIDAGEIERLRGSGIVGARPETGQA
jgi:crotonobetainyl-CoA:carnitine CoA-transferase CaiB-like acyl-CoA transferase